MTKPDDIPQDVWDATNALVPGTVTAYTVEHRRNYRYMVARALLAQRENDARIAEVHADEKFPASHAAYGYGIAAAIRKGTA